MVAGNPELFVFPSTLYQQLNLAYTSQNRVAVQKLLQGLQKVFDDEATICLAEKILLNSRPFYAGGTHLAWRAVDALVVPVRVNEHSIESLELRFKLLTNPTRDFQQWHKHAGAQATRDCRHRHDDPLGELRPFHSGLHQHGGRRHEGYPEFLQG